MAKVILMPIGSTLDIEQIQYAANRKKMQALDDLLDKNRLRIKEGWGPQYTDRIHQKGKLSAHERIELLADSAADIYPIQTFVNDGIEFGDGSTKKSSPSAGVLTALLRVNKRVVMVVANDNTVASGSWWPKTPEKIIRAQEMALRLRLPIVYLVDCSGLFLPEQSKSFPGKSGAGKIFKMNSLLSDAGVPQIAGVFGDCIAGGGYMPIISDKVYMTEQAYMVIAGAALIRGAKSLHLSSLDIGGADIHVNVSNCADYRVPNDTICIERIREEIRSLPSSAAAYYQADCDAAAPALANSDMSAILPTDSRMVYDVRQVIARLVDNSLFWELFAEQGQEVIVGIARINGLFVGIAANVQELTPHPHDPKNMRAGGILYREGVAKLAAFSRACNDDGIPLIWLQDISGFDVGVEAEKQGLLGYGSSLIYSNSTNTVPMITVLLRKASGAGYYAMAGMPYDPIIQLSTPISRLAVMEGKTLAIGAFNTKLDDNFEIKSGDPQERAQIEQGMKEVEARIEADMDPYKAASQMDSDEIVKLSELRSYLEILTESCYQNCGSRRIKNPRIWSLHDLHALYSQLPQQHHIKAAKSDDHKKESTQATHCANTGAYLQKSPLSGTFYRSASPQDPPLVNEGDLIQPGASLGLIEAMKVFNTVTYTGSKALRLDKFLIENSTAVESGQEICVFIN